jgi:hypothetical protein
MITLPHHCEFLSDAWLEQATKFLQRDVAMRKENLGGRGFSLSERFTHAPPHLKFAGDVAAWNVAFDGNDLTVSRGFDERADFVVEGDYQAGLTAAQYVGLLAPGAMKAMNREVVTVYGRDAIRTRGVLEGELREMFLLLHDHMGRRTVENPDLAHPRGATTSARQGTRTRGQRDTPSSNTRFHRSSPMKCATQCCAHCCRTRRSR